MAIKIEMLRCFHEVADHGSLMRGAEALGRTPSAVSMMLKQFEDHIGAPLFETGRKSRLTALGLMVHREAQRTLAHFDRSVDTIEALSRAQAGLVRLAVTPSASNTVLAPVIEAFAQAHPMVQIDLRDMQSAEVLRALQNEQADIGIGSLPRSAGLLHQDLFCDQFGVVCRRDHPLAQNWEALTWADVAPHRFISNGLCAQLHDAGFAPILAASVMMVPTTQSLLALVNAGVGVTLLPQRALPPSFTDLIFLPLLDSQATRQVDIVTPPLEKLSPAVLAFLQKLQES